MQTTTSVGASEIKLYGTQKPTYASAYLLRLTMVPVERAVALVLALTSGRTKVLIVIL